MNILKEKTQVHLLPSKNNQFPSNNLLLFNKKLRQCAAGGEYRRLIANGAIPQEIYITSNEKPQKGDWVVNLYSGSIFMWDGEYGIKPDEPYGKYPLETTTIKKIIAITDVLPLYKAGIDVGLFLPQPSQGFIEKYIKMYNQGNVITEVLVEYEEKPVEELHDMYSIKHKRNQKLKVNPKDNTITIHPIKNSWSRKEVIELIKRFSNHFCSMNNHFEDDENRWIENNL